MSNHDLDRLFNRFNEYAVGFDPIFRNFQHSSGGYPPHNIVTVSDTEFYLEIAVAGFKKNEITIKEENGVLTITADKSAQTESLNYQYRGLAKRSFSKTLHVAEYFEISEAKLEDGILTVRFVKNVPEDKSKYIAIN